MGSSELTALAEEAALGGAGVPAEQAAPLAAYPDNVTVAQLLRRLPDRDLTPPSSRRWLPGSPTSRSPGRTTSPSTETTASTSRCTATPTSTCGCCAGPRRTTPASTTTTCPRARSPWSAASLVEHNLTIDARSPSRRRSRPDRCSASARTTSTGSTAPCHGSVSVHAYSPPLWRMGQYAVTDAGVLRRVVALLRRRASPDRLSRSRTPRTGPMSARPWFVPARPTARTSSGGSRPSCRSDTWSDASWAGPAGRSRWSASAPGSSAPTGARSREADARGGAGGRGRGRRHVLRHRRRLRRRAQRAGHRRASWPTTPSAGVTVATKMGRRVDAGAGELHAGQLPGLDRPLARATSASTRLDLVQLHCPPTAVIDDDAAYDALDTLVDDGAIAAYGVSVETVDAGADRDRPAARRDGADHPQRVPAQAAGARCCRRRPRPGSGSSRGCRWPPACCPGRYDAHDHLRRGRPPHLQPRRQRLRRRRDVLGRRLRRRASRRPREFTDAGRATAPDGVTAGAGGARLGRAAARRHHGDPRRPQRGAGARQRGRGRARRRSATDVPGRRRPDLRRADPRRWCTTAGDGSGPDLVERSARHRAQHLARVPVAGSAGVGPRVDLPRAQRAQRRIASSCSRPRVRVRALMCARSGNVSGAAAKAPRALARSSASVTIGPAWRAGTAGRRRRRRTPSPCPRTRRSGVRPAAPASRRRAARPSSVMVYSRLRRFPVNRSVATAYPSRGELLRLVVELALGPRPEPVQAALHLLGQLVGGPGAHGQQARTA